MKIAVCIKQVPSTNKVRMDPVTNTIIRDGKDAVINPYDLFALELAITLSERYGAHVTAFSMGIPATESLLRDAVARGISGAVLLTDRAFAGADTLATSYTLARGIASAGKFDLILCGRMAIDGDTAQIGPELAEALGIPHVSGVSEIISLSENKAIAVRLTDSAAETLEIALPALLTIQKDINIPRMPSIAGIRRSLAEGFTLKRAADISADPRRLGLDGSPTQVVRTFVPQADKLSETIEGTAAEKTAKLLNIIGEVRK